MMCEWGTDKTITLTRRVVVDACIADEVARLNEQGVRTESSCCGHGKPDVPSTIGIRAADQARARELGYDPWYPESTEQGLDPRDIGVMVVVPKTACASGEANIDTIVQETGFERAAVTFALGRFDGDKAQALAWLSSLAESER